MAGVVGGGVDVDFHDLDLGVADVIGHPLGVDQHFGTRIARLGDLGCRFGHGPLSLKLTNWIHKLNNEASQSTGGQAQGSSRSTVEGRLDRRKASDEALFEPAEMSQAVQYTPAGPEQPARRRGRTRLLLVPLGIVVLLLAIPGGAYAFSQNRLSQAQGSEANSAYAQALSEYATVEAFAGNPVSRVLLGELSDRAQVGTAETHFLWGVQLRQQGKFAEGEAQLRAAVKSGFADWGARGNAALADLF